MKNAVDQIAGLIIEANKVALFTGAGVSTESGISDFRSPDGIWSRYDPEDFTIQRFVADKEARKRNWQLRRELVSANYQPTMPSQSWKNWVNSPALSPKILMDCIMPPGIAKKRLLSCMARLNLQSA